MKTYVIDIDGTICENKKNESACYSESAPKLDRIKKINKLFEEGNKIIYLTARGMGRFNNNPLFATQELYSLTEAQLKTWGCKYHSLFLGKPSGDFYIDDKGINDEDFFTD